MKLFNTYGPCFGISIYQRNQLSVELWFVPPQYEIPAHSHPNEHIELYHVYGRSLFSRECPIDKRHRCAMMDTFSWLQHFTVPAGWNHWFSTTKTWLIFFNVAKWKDGVKPTSASEDFKNA